MAAHISQEMLMLSFLMVLPIGYFSFTSAVSAGCECVVFDTTYSKEYGIFTSPNWPTPYEDNIECLLYTFVAGDDEMVEISFDEFDLQKTNLECVFGDFVKLFLHLEEPSVNEKSPYNSILCGKIMDIEQTHYSSGPTLIFEFHTDWRRTNSTGFSGTYRFLKVFQTDGHLISGSKCNYEISPEQLNRTRGKFYSPQYPSNYPRDVTCFYKFASNPNTRIKIVFEQIRLQKGDLSCLNSPDAILVYDGGNRSAPIIGHLCNTNSFVELVSTGSHVFVEFHSRSHFPGQGFKASYLFDGPPPPPPRVNDVDVPYVESIRRQTDYRADYLSTTPESVSSPCSLEFSSDVSKNGTFTSPNYPEPYPKDIFCVYKFKGQGKERVQIQFTDFDLHLPHETPKDCDGVDAVMVFITINGQKERLDNFCGNKLPAQMMSNGPGMLVEFRALHTSPEVKGFRAIYKFVTDFGITGPQDSTSVCGFNYKSDDLLNGTFQSPNYPGLYPRNTECHYFFYGVNKERVHITFGYFNVDGIPPCMKDTWSDYLEFSNFKAVDRKIPRHCGIKKPKVIESDGDFFRVTFKSNDKFDGTGFQANYYFKPFIDPATVKRISDTSKNSTSSETSYRLDVLFMSMVPQILMMFIYI